MVGVVALLSARIVVYVMQAFVCHRLDFLIDIFFRNARFFTASDIVEIVRWKI